MIYFSPPPGHDLSDDEIAADQKKGVGYLYLIFAGECVLNFPLWFAPRQSGV